MYQRIILAADGSEHALRATDHAIKFVESVSEYRLDIVIVMNEEKKGKQSINLARLVEEKLKLTKQKLKQANVHFRTIILIGDPKHEIVKYAKREEVDLCIIGSRGLNKFQEMVLGSISHKTVKHINCPILIIK
ncbi:Nucleotide-binding universal stress protein, UspA family [Gracilibacillus orientalis]|uniref:Nucleotide-binding universal stress protein, UspA family n=1 Tax=Gracilibacillus orientalis TaxID=334253 RepID=A0A1I4QHW5_9BACI|nr:universal stress protein [Gracilibacillus orientalis]SFM39275.1 Nucleotide-binding universal stress protein, UspA family [Gracilibacillus orientalis]